MKYINLISDKIDYMFRRGKNADERCFDFFLRSITFFIILLVILLYGSFANADESYTTIGDAGLITDVFTSDGLNSALSNANKTTSDFVSVGIASGLSSYPFSLDDLQNLKIPSSITYNNNIYTPEDYFIFLTRGNVSDHGISYLTCYIFVGEDFVIGNAGYTVYNFESSGIGIFAAAVNPNNLNQLWDDNPVYTQQTQGINSDTNGFDSSITYQYFTIPNPIYYSSNQFYGLLNDTSIDSNVRSDFTYQYYHYPDNLYQLNYLYDELHFIPEPAESNENHLFLNDIQVGITSNNIGQDILSSSVVIGVDPDDWIENNSDDFNLGVTYTLHFKDTMPSTPNDPTKAFGVMLPIRTFFNQNYSYGIAEIFRNMDMLNYYNSLSEGGVSIITDFTYKALLPSPLKAFEQTLGQYICKQMGATEEILNPYTVFDATLTVDCVLVDTVSGEMSHRYIKEFDFIHGNESVKNADILKNYNPWEGEQTPQQSPLVPSAGNSVGGYGGSNNNITVNVSGQKVPMNVHNQQEIQRALDSYTDVTNHFNNLWGDISNENSNSSFLAIINSSLSEIPYMNYMIKCAMVIFGMAVILFVLKVLLF